MLVTYKIKFRKLKVGEIFTAGGHPFIKIRKTKDKEGDIVNAKSEYIENYLMIFHDWENVYQEK